MNPKLLALLATIAATALTQMANACGGACEPCDEKPEKPAKPAGKKAPAPAEKEEEDDNTFIADDTADDNDDDDTPDYEALRKQAKKLVGALFEVDAANKKKVKAILDALGEANIGDMDNDNLQPFVTKLNKLKAK